MTDAIELIDFFYNGLPPVTGGVLDQSAWFLAAAKRLKSEDTMAKADQ